MVDIIWEWVGDNYYSSSPAIIPTGPTSVDYRAVRGDSFDDAANDLNPILNPILKFGVTSG